MLVIIIGFHQDTGEAIAGKIVSNIESDEQAVAYALDWCAWDSPEEIGGWRAYEYLPSWGPGREIKP